MMETIDKSVIQLRIELVSFTSIDEVMAYESFRGILEKHIKELKDKHNNRPLPPAGMHYKRSPIDQMMEASELNVHFMLQYYPAVYNKISSIPSAKREVMKYVCSNAIHELINSVTVIVKQNDKFQVEELRAKLKVISINQKDSTITIELSKKRETWSINTFVKSIKDKTLIKI